MSFVGRCYFLEEVAGSSGDDDNRNVPHIILILSSSAGAKMSFVGRFYSLEEAARNSGDDDNRNEEQAEYVICWEMLFPGGSSGDDDNRNVPHIILILQSSSAGAKMSFVGICYSLEEAAGSSGDDDNRNVHHIF
ncbi:hypothetical protein CEXT_597641 [Caerostris extrusa]|uniref:Uncharacterized protein n=1 Tax=Caerostris extrusa TaxID=172846 RepID=A0AAV4RPP3_CAEEX|nr:hypothetical protein CEXT_597641 [Caerostris extrusa]